MDITNINGPDIEQDWINETTRYWFDMEVDGEPEQFCLVDTNGDTQILDADGAPLTESDHLTIYVRKAIQPLYEQVRFEGGG